MISHVITIISFDIECEPKFNIIEACQFGIGVNFFELEVGVFEELVGTNKLL